MMWSVWWVWIVAGFALGVLEVLAPGFIFLGFAAGALATGVLIGLGIPNGSLSLLLLIFAVLSVLSWLGLRQAFGVKGKKKRAWDKDIND
jgi:membrane protein implicated in regulation of membrane protease activity